MVASQMTKPTSCDPHLSWQVDSRRRREEPKSRDEEPARDQGNEKWARKIGCSSECCSEHVKLEAKMHLIIDIYDR